VVVALQAGSALVQQSRRLVVGILRLVALSGGEACCKLATSAPAPGTRREAIVVGPALQKLQPGLARQAGGTQPRSQSAGLSRAGSRAC